MLDVHFENQVLRLASKNCEVGNLIKTVISGQKILEKNSRSKVHDSHQSFACILKNQDLNESRLLEDFEVISDFNNDKYHLAIKLCPLKYEFFRRPSLIFRPDLSFINVQEYKNQNHEALIYECLKSEKYHQELRICSKLNWTLFRPQSPTFWKSADFLLKSDPKLGGVIMYSTQVGSKTNLVKSPHEESQFNYFIFVILSECELCFRLPKGPKKGQYQILFKPKSTKAYYDYLSINKEQAVKALSFETRSDFISWFSAIRLAKFGLENLNSAYKNNMLPILSGEKLPTSCDFSRTFKSKAMIDLQKVKGLNSILKLKTKARTQSLSWSESITSLSQMNSSGMNSQLSLLSSSEDSSASSGGISGSSGGISGFTGKKPKPASAMLSDVPYEPHENDSEYPSTIEEPDFVPMDMSKSKGCEIITDPEMIQQIEEESALKSRFRSVKSLPFNEPWFTTKNRTEVEHLLQNNYHIDGYFLVTPDYRDTNLSLYLNVMFNDVLHHYKIVQHLVFGKGVFTLDGSCLNFSNLSQLVEFHSLNLVKPLPCHLTESPIVS